MILARKLDVNCTTLVKLKTIPQGVAVPPEDFWPKA